jgi:hypothetical protein
MRTQARGSRSLWMRRIHVTAALLAFGLPASGGMGAGAATRVIEQSRERVIFEVATPRPTLTPRSVDGRAYTEIGLPESNSRDEAGSPDLPFIECLIAVPPGMQVSAQVLSQEPAALGRMRPLPVPEAQRPFAPDPSAALDPRSPALPEITLEYREAAGIYGGATPYPGSTVELGPAYNWRHYRVVPVRVSPLRYDPAAGELFWSPSVRVRVDFVTTKSDPRSRPGTQAYPYAEPRWDGIFEQAIVNYATARETRVWQPLAAAAPRARAGAIEFKVEVDTVGIYRVTFEELAAAGLDAAELTWAELGLAVRDYDDANEADPFREYPIAYETLDADGDGLFEPGEALVFYGEDAWSFFDLSPGDRRYGRRNVYWIVYGSENVARMASQASWFDWTGLFPLVKFRRTAHYEQNLYYMSILAADDVENPDAGPQGVHTDHYNWTYNSPREGSFDKRFKLVGFDLPDLAPADVQPTEVCVHLQGQGYIGGSSTAYHRPRLWLSRSAVPEDTAWAFPGNPYIIPPTDDFTACADARGLPVTTIGAGRNYVKIYLPRRDDGFDNVDGYGIGIDWVDVTYESRFKIADHRLYAPLAGEVGRRQFLIRNLPSDRVRVFDVGDPRAPVALTLDPSQVVYSAANQSWDLKLQLECPPAPAVCELMVVEDGQYDRLPAGAITMRRTEVPPFAQADYVLIYPRQFAAEVAPLVAHREAQGHRVFDVAVEDVYDSYAGGRPHPYAIKRLLRRMWRESAPAPEYLLLFGDASNDLGQYLPGLPQAAPLTPSDTSFVATITIPGHYFGVTGTELVSCDPWFVDNLSGAWDDPVAYAPDLHVGRVPCGTREEAATYVSKVIDYEQGNEAAAWRRRITFLADDDFSSDISGLGGAGTYRRKAGEWRFLDITRHAAAMITGDSLFSGFAIDSLYLNGLMDSIPELGRCQPDTLDATECLRNEHGAIVQVDYATNVNFGLNSQYAQTVVKGLTLSALDRGALVYAFQGHSNRWVLTHEFVFADGVPYGREDASDLSNVGRPFVFMGFGCHLCAFAGADEGSIFVGDAMAEKLLFCCASDPRAAIGAIGSTDFETIGHDYEEKVFEAMFPDPPADALGARRWRLGEIVSHSKSKLSSRKRERLTYTLLGDPALRIGTAPPVIDLALNGVAWDPEGGTEYAAAREDDSLAVRIELRDESTTGLPEVEDYYGAVPPARLIPGSVDDREGRRRVLYYATQVQRRPYQLRVRAIDYDGAVREVAVALPFEVKAYEQSGTELEALADGALVGSRAELALTLRCSAHLQPADVRLLADGTPVTLARADLVPGEGGPDHWTLRYEELPAVTGETFTLEAQVAQRDGAWLSLLQQSQRVGTEPLRIEDLAWIPNPFADECTLTYRLTAPASRVRLRLFTSSGRGIFKDEQLPAGKGSRHFVWDGRDDDGDPVANGLYFYEILIWDGQGREADRRLDKLIRVR